MVTDKILIILVILIKSISVKRMGGRWPAHRTGKKSITYWSIRSHMISFESYDMTHIFIKQVDLWKGHMIPAMNSHNLNMHHSFRQTQFNQGFRNVLQRLLAKGWDFLGNFYLKNIFSIIYAKKTKKT